MLPLVLCCKISNCSMARMVKCNSYGRNKGPGHPQGWVSDSPIGVLFVVVFAVWVNQTFREAALPPLFLHENRRSISLPSLMDALQTSVTVVQGKATATL